jgi:hypothetical protein
MVFDDPPSDTELSRLLLGDLHADFAGRVARLRLLVALDHDFGGEGVMLPGGPNTQMAYLEARASFVAGNYLATILLSQTLVENLLGAFIHMENGSREIRGGSFVELSSKPALDELLKQGQTSGLLNPDDVENLRRVRSLRNPLTHYRHINDAANLHRRALDERVHFEQLMMNDARFCIGVVIALLGKSPFAIGRRSHVAAG